MKFLNNINVSNNSLKIIYHINYINISNGDIAVTASI